MAGIWLFKHEKSWKYCKSWVILLADKNDQDYLNFYNNITDTLTQTLFIDMKTSATPLELSGGCKLDVVKYTPDVLKSFDKDFSEEFEFSSISSLETSHESEPKEPNLTPKKQESTQSEPKEPEKPDSTQSEPTPIPIKPDLTSSSSSNTVGIIIAIASILAIVVMISIGYYYYRKNYK